MVLNAAVQMLKEAEELKQKILKYKSGTSMLQDRSLWTTQQELQKVYEKVLVLDLDYALDKKVEQDLWNIGFKQQIEVLQAISKDRKNPLRSDGQAMLSWVLQAAAGFYLCLLHQICTTFKLDLPFRRRASLLGWVEGWGAGEAAQGARLPPPAAARYICQHCLVHLGDLARYRQQFRVAHTFYRHALVVSAHSGQPYNQLALVSWRRGRRLCALYWHVRSLLVRAPFPPAPANLARTLAAAASRETIDLPVLEGVSRAGGGGAAGAVRGAAPQRLDAHAYVNELIRALHMIHNLEELETAAEIVNNLNASLTALVATDSFESMTLIRMSCVVMWALHSSTEGLQLEGSALSDTERAGAALAGALAAGALLALLLPAYLRAPHPPRALPALKVWLQWAACSDGAAGRVWAARPQLWPALAHALNALHAPHPPDAYMCVPLSEDEELVGFTPLERGFESLRFAQHAAWDTYGGRIPDNIDLQHSQPLLEVSSCLSNEPELEHKVRAHRILALGKQLAEHYPEHLTYTVDDERVTFTAADTGGEQLAAALAELRQASEGEGETAPARGESGSEEEQGESEDERPPAPPLIISEADFREKVREKRVGILKPQGSLERAREERALASTQDTQEDDGEESSKCEDKKEARKPRVNIAMAAIMRKQEESNKQVKFVSPPPTPVSAADVNSVKEQDKPKIIQTKVLKSLTNLPVGRKTGGILSLKDKSGYPHLVNTDTEPVKKEKEDKKELKPSQSSQNSQSYQQKRVEHPPPQNWSANIPPNIQEARMTFPKNYSAQSPALNFSYQAQPSVNQVNQEIRLPVVNPKEIDVRTAALQKQNSRHEMFQDAHKFGNPNYQVSGDKKNFLNDLPPRFANQYRYWQSSQENRFNDNQFREDTDKTNVYQQPQPSNWLNQPEHYQAPPPWWKPENPPNFNTNYSMNMQPNFYSQVSNPYQNVYMQNQGMGQKDGHVTPNFMPSVGPQMQNIPNLAPSFNSNIASYSPYDASMYPQFGNRMGYQMDKEMDRGLGLGGNLLDAHRMGVSFNEQSEVKADASGAGGSTYSLFSGAPDAHRHPQIQSLWSGPGPSPLERLLEQQKQMKQSPAPQ